MNIVMTFTLTFFLIQFLVMFTIIVVALLFAQPQGPLLGPVPRQQALTRSFAYVTRLPRWKVRASVRLARLVRDNLYLLTNLL